MTVYSKFAFLASEAPRKIFVGSLPDGIQDACHGKRALVSVFRCLSLARRPYYMGSSLISE